MTAPLDDPAKALYVHLADDGGILVVRGATGESEWITTEELDAELTALRERGGRLLYSRDSPGSEPPAEVEALFRRIVDSALPGIQLLDEPHPDARGARGA